MKDLVQRLEKEVGLTHEQAKQSIGIFRDYLIECDDDPDMVEMMKVKASHMASTAKSKYEDLTDKADQMVDKVGDKITNVANQAGDKADELLHKAKQKAKGAVDKLSDYLDD